MQGLERKREMTVDVEKIKAGTDRKSNECSCRDALNNE